MNTSTYATVAFWVNEETILENESSHVRAVLDAPERFGFSGAEELRAIYRAHGERIGKEGRTRAEIILRATRNGWVRVRHYVHPGDYWSIQVDVAARRAATIRRFIDYALGRGIMGETDELRITATDEGRTLTYRFRDGGVGRYLEELNDQGEEE